MGRFEPQVLESIKRSRRKILLEDTLVLIFITLVLFICAFLAFFAFGRRPGSLILVMMWSCAIAAAALHTLCVHRSYHLFFKAAHEFNPVSLQTFERALESVSLGAGIDTPPIVILDIPTVNIVAFKIRGGYSIGITREAVETPMLMHEAEALMANQVSHILIGDALGPFGIWRSKGLPVIPLALMVSLAYCAFLFLIFLFIMSYTGEAGEACFVLCLSFFLLPWAGTIASLIVKRFDVARRHNELLADSLATKITGNPEALRDMVEWAALQFEAAETVPQENLCNRHLFVCPRELCTEHRGLSIRNLLLPGWSDPEIRTRWERETTVKRIDNLAAIEHGHWPAFGA